MPDFGPFSVDPAQVAALGGANFGQFVGRLLATETAAHNMVGTTLETTYLENVGDGGVDAGLRDAEGTAWLPAGDSAWQFKAGDLQPAKCKKELEGATWAIEILRAGGSYRLVLGASLTSKKLADRRAKLVEAFDGLGIPDGTSRVEVIAADALARWIEEFPALAVSPLLRSTGIIGQAFDQWAQSTRHATSWVSSPERDRQISELRITLADGTQVDIHVDGVSGLGKTRLVLEALRGQPYEAIVVYSGAADSFPITNVTQLQSLKRAAVIVVDECDRKQHEIYAQALSVGTAIRLVTIGEPGGISTRTPMIGLRVFSDEAMEELLRANHPALSPEAERVVVQIAAGNIDYALRLAQVAVNGGAGSAGGMVTEDDLRAFFTDHLPEGQLFLASCALALFSRVGFDGEPAAEIEIIAQGLGIPVDDLKAAAGELSRRELLSKQGRFRSVAPYPVAVYLATKAWDEFGPKVVADLLPLLDLDFTERLFRRAAEIGELDAASSAMATALADGGPLATLESIAENSNSALLPHFAVLAPEAVADRLALLIEAASEDDLVHARGIRRDLVWALEKLAWHSKTFVIAAEALLRLAVAENETYSNNASGTWTEFFGVMLPGTAAAPDVRMAYLRRSVESTDPRVRLLSVRGASRALEVGESIMVSGEVQGGVVVEPRGRPATWPEVWAYQNSAIDLLAALTTDPDDVISKEATARLIEPLHGLLESPAVRDHLGETVAQLSPDVMAKTRLEVEGLRSLFERVDVQDGRPAALEAFEAFLPDESPEDRLAVLAGTKTWDRELEGLVKELAEAARLIETDGPADPLVRLLESTAGVPAAYAFGCAIRRVGIDFSKGLAILSPFAGTSNGEALVGFLHALVDEGDSSAFDRYLDDADLPPAITLQYSVRGPRTVAAAVRVDQLIGQVTVHEGARVLFGWTRDADQADAARFLRDWSVRIESQADYNAAVDFAAMQVFQRPEPMPDLDPAISDLVVRRRDYPDVRQQSWDWSVLVRRHLEQEPLEVVRLIADLVEAGALTLSGTEDGKLLQDAVHLAGDDGWTELMDRLGRGEWRLSFSVREWLGTAATVGIAKRWVGSSVERARVLANVTKPDGAELSPIACYLIEEFGDDERVPSYLVGQFISGFWSGNESDRIASQIVQVKGWIAVPGQSTAVKSWGRKLVSSLDYRRRSAVEEEQERGW
ncbi:MAG: hypothetical protein EPN48_15460 [Microbacteriaceae bacterium]|nr:MAG: hypothetical protein EPN48_15460 [Microbacteriaceae bacterium]